MIDKLIVLPRAILWHPLLLEHPDHLLVQVCLPGLAPYLFLAYPFYLQQASQSSAAYHHHPSCKAQCSPTLERCLSYSGHPIQELTIVSELHRHSSQRHCPSGCFHRAQAPKSPLYKRHRLTLPLSRRPSVQSCAKTVIPTTTQGHCRVYRDGGAYTHLGRQPKENGLAARR